MYIGSVHTDQDELLKAITTLYLNGQPFDLDPTFNKGAFYKAIQRPKHIGDLKPLFKWVPQMDVRQLPWELWNLDSAMFDPPFLVGEGKMIDRYGGFPNITDLWIFYDQALENFHRVLRPGGTLVVKTQDASAGGQNFFSHIHLANYGVSNGFELIDLLVLVNQNKIKNNKPSRMARKEHCFFLVFKKIERATRNRKF